VFQQDKIPVPWRLRFVGPHVRNDSYEMEGTDGEPDVVAHDKETGEYIFLHFFMIVQWKEHKPENNAIDTAAAMGIELFQR